MSSTPASLWLRIAAGVYDLFPLVALWMLTAGLALLVAHGDVDLAHPSLGWLIGLRGALFVVTAAYFVISWARGGQTIGMRAWRLRVVSVQGDRLAWSRAFARFAASLLSLLALGVGFLWCLFEPDRRGWHDLLVGSRVIRLPK